MQLFVARRSYLYPYNHNMLLQVVPMPDIQLVSQLCSLIDANLPATDPLHTSNAAALPPVDRDTMEGLFV